MFAPHTIRTTTRAQDEEHEVALRNAVAERNLLVGELAAKGGERAAAPFTKRRMALFGAAFALATAAFAGVMLYSPPTSEAADIEGISIARLHASAPLSLGAAEAGHEH